MQQSIDWSAWRFWFDVVHLLGTLFVGAWVILARRERIKERRVKSVEDQMKDRVTRDEMNETFERHETACHSHHKQTTALVADLNRLQSEVNHLPSRAEIAKLNDNMTNLTEKMGKFEGRLDGVNRLADLINEHLINKGA